MGRRKNPRTVSKKKVGKSRDDDADTIVDENENVSIRLPLKQKDIEKLGFKKEKRSENKKLIKVSMFAKEDDIKKKQDKESESESSSESESTIETESESESESESEPESKAKPKKKNEAVHNDKTCQGCISRDEKIKEMKVLIKELTENVKLTNGIDSRERKSILSHMNFIEGKKKWQPKTGIGCLWDGHPFKSVPCPMPLRFYKNKYQVYGCFCSFNCSLAFIINLG